MATGKTGWHASSVALLAEGVDRNFLPLAVVVRDGVALLAEGVDRNSAYRSQWSWHPGVALLAEGVDRNLRAFFRASIS